MGIDIVHKFVDLIGRVGPHHRDPCAGDRQRQALVGQDERLVIAMQPMQSENTVGDTDEGVAMPSAARMFERRERRLGVYGELAESEVVPRLVIGRHHPGEAIENAYRRVPLAVAKRNLSGVNEQIRAQWLRVDAAGRPLAEGRQSTLTHGGTVKLSL